MDGLVQIQVVVQGNAVAVGLMGLDSAGACLVRRTLRSKVTCALLHQVDKDRRASVARLW